ncbi:MAG: bis-aminopropyl spermidine synthase family protein [Nitrospiraceae bacterium]|nr:bis-aminopropyl spermidine synthase family protein [Nitrospiraceae bacterium]
MSQPREIDLRSAINAISDVAQNRPRPLRQLDKIYMKTGDMVLQSELVARWAQGKKLAFIGDGDAISVCIAYLQKRNIINYGPSEIGVFDFDERICGAVTRFADKEELRHLRAELYNCLDPFPGPTGFDCFYTNPPWGASNDGESVKVFMQWGMEATGYKLPSPLKRVHPVCSGRAERRAVCHVFVTPSSRSSPNCVKPRSP